MDDYTSTLVETLGMGIEQRKSAIKQIDEGIVAESKKIEGAGDAAHALFVVFLSMFAGAEYTYGAHARAHNTREVCLRISVHHMSPEGLKVFGKEVASVR